MWDFKQCVFLLVAEAVFPSAMHPPALPHAAKSKHGAGPRHTPVYSHQPILWISIVLLIFTVQYSTALSSYFFVHNIHYTPPTWSSLTQSKKHIPAIERLSPSDAHSLLVFLTHCEGHTFLSTFLRYLVHIGFSRIFLAEEGPSSRTRNPGSGPWTGRDGDAHSRLSCRVGRAAPCFPCSWPLRFQGSCLWPLGHCPLLIEESLMTKDIISHYPLQGLWPQGQLPHPYFHVLAS